MTTTTVVLLVVLWGVVLVPGAWRDRRSSPATTVDGFADAMARLASCDARSILVPAQGGGWLVHPRPSPRQLLLARRRAVALRLVGFVVATFWTAVFGGGLWWVAFTGALTTFGGYLAVLRWSVVREQEVARVVRELHPAARPSVSAPSATPVATDADDLVLDEVDLWREGAVVASGSR